MTPYRTAEARWFQRGEIPASARAWFDGLTSSSLDGVAPPAEPEARTDHYLAPTSAALGVKLREGQVEAKRRDGVLAPLAVGRSQAPVEAWAKWSFGLAEAADEAADAVPSEGWVEVRKTRWQHALGTCALELSHVEVDGEPWWSVCLEATGPDDDARRAALADAARQWLGHRDAPALAEAHAQGYPAWLLGRNT